MKTWVESGKFERQAESLFDRCETPIRFAAAFCAGVLFGVAWMIAQGIN